MVGNTSTIRDSNGWYWKFKNNKKDTFIPIRNPFQKEVEKIASSFYITNFPDYVDAKRSWKECQPYGRIVDVFIANKRSKLRKRFVFVRFLRVKNEEEFVRSLASIWIGSYHLFASVACFKRHETKEDPSKKAMEKMSSHSSFPKAEQVGSTQVKKSYASTLNGDEISKVGKQEEKKKQLILSDQELVQITNPLEVALVKVKISGLPLCAWGSNAYKKVASSVGKFMFFENGRSTALSLGRVYVVTRQKSFISEVVSLTIHRVEYDVQVQELGSWSISLEEPSLQESETNSQVSNESDKEVEFEFEGDKIEDKQENKHDVEEENKMVKVREESIHSNTGHAVEEEKIPDIEMDHKDKSSTSDWSRPPGFEHYNNIEKDHLASSLQSKSSKCPPSFDTYRRKDIRGISIIHEMSKLIEVGEKLGYDVNGSFRPSSGRSKFYMDEQGGYEDEQVRSILKSYHATNTFPDVKVMALSRGWSDHTPIMLHCYMLDYGPLLKERDDIHQLEGMDLVQKARVRWDVEGDENMKFFHRILKQKRHQQMVQGIMIDGEWVTIPLQVKTAFNKFYKEKFDASDSLMELSLVVSLATLNHEDNIELEKQVSEEEIRLAV
ncbi:RNA-directed DNA polymerase, eukaryota, reverse transcriptase zinc-binding domain protein [Tanacetum coccineum]